jgi:transcriptional regulator with XRE-family HTH domain
MPRKYTKEYTDLEPAEAARQTTTARALREYLRESGQTQAQLAAGSGVSQAAFTRVLTQQQELSVENLRNVSRYTGLSVDYLLGLSSCKTTDADMQAVCQFSGASDAVIAAYRAARDADKKSDGKEPSRIDALNVVLPAIIGGDALNIAEFLQLAQAAAAIERRRPETPELDALNHGPVADTVEEPGINPYADPATNPPVPGSLNHGTIGKEHAALDVFNAEYRPALDAAEYKLFKTVEVIKSALWKIGGVHYGMD